MIDQTETRRLVYEIAPDIKLWRWCETNRLELVFSLDGGHSASYQSDDAGFFANVLVLNGHSEDYGTALNVINKAWLS